MTRDRAQTMADLQTAIACFQENLMDYRPETNIEKYNLYQGLAAMAEVLAEIQREIRALPRNY